MSRTFRFIRKYSKFFLWTIAILIIPSFIIWGVGSAVRDQNRSRFAGTLFKHKVSWTEFDQAYKTTVMLLVMSDLGAYLSFLDPVELTWERLILLQEIKKRKIRVADQEVIEHIQKIPAFRNPDGFDQKRYEETLELRFQTIPRTFEEELRKTLAISKLRDQVMQEVQLDDETLWKEYRAQHDKRRIAVIEFEAEAFEKEVSVTEEELRIYFEMNAASFERPEAIRLQTAGLAFEGDDKKEVQRRLDEAAGELAATDAKAYPDAFETVAKKWGFVLRTTDPFTFFAPPADLANELLVEATRLEPGLVSEAPVETSSGVYLVKLLERQKPRTPSLDEARPEVEKTLGRKKAESLCQEKARGTLQEIQGKSAAGTSFEEAAKSLGLSIRESAPFSRGEPVEGVGASAELTRAAFALALNEVGGVVKTPRGFAILEPKEEIPASRENFEAEKETFRENTLQQKRLQHFNEWFLVLKASAEQTSNIESQEEPR